VRANALAPQAMNDQALELAEWSRAVRESSLKRLRTVPTGSENWRPVADAMSFGDLAHHIVEADEWLFRKLEARALEPIVGHAGAVTITTREQYMQLLRDLEKSGTKRAQLVAGFSDEQLRERVDDRRFGGRVTVWWIVVRGNIDHEIHHRGQISAYLRMAGIDAP
jgi:uncharacterized damage-inducible protein DinB